MHAGASTSFFGSFPGRALVVALAMTGFFVGYFWLLNHPLRPVTEIPALALDHAVPLLPWTVVIYASLWVYVSIPPMHVAGGRTWLVFMAGWMGLGVLGLAIFAMWPTRMELPDVDWSAHPSVAFLKSVDQAGNACPSLHVAYAVHAAIWLHGLVRQWGAGRWAQVLNVAWAAAIVISTLTTKQHVVIDVAVGAVLGGGLGIAHRRYANWSSRGMTAV